MLQMANDIGKWYWVVGQGPMRLAEGTGGQNRRMETAGGTSYWAAAADVRLLTPEMLDTFEADSKARGYDVSYLPDVRQAMGK